MPKVICTIENASTNINGVAFVPCVSGMMSEEVSQAVADNFLLIEGYELIDVEQPAKKRGKTPVAPLSEDSVN